MTGYNDFDLDQALVFCKILMSVGQQLDMRIRQLFLCWFSSLRWVKVQVAKMIVLRSEIPSSMCAKLRTVAASNNRDHPTRSLSSSPLASTINCSPGSQAL